MGNAQPTVLNYLIFLACINSKIRPVASKIIPGTMVAIIATTSAITWKVPSRLEEVAFAVLKDHTPKKIHR